VRCPALTDVGPARKARAGLLTDPHNPVVVCRESVSGDYVYES
jgi:hypothetical protein